MSTVTEAGDTFTYPTDLAEHDGRALWMPAAVGLWRRLGFEIVGTVPGALGHPEHGDVALHVMHRRV